MPVYARLKNEFGHYNLGLNPIVVIWSDNVEDQTYLVYSTDIEHSFDPEFNSCVIIKYSDVAVTDTNIEIVKNYNNKYTELELRVKRIIDRWYHVNIKYSDEDLSDLVERAKHLCSIDNADNFEDLDDDYQQDYLHKAVNEKSKLTIDTDIILSYDKAKALFEETGYVHMAMREVEATPQVVFLSVPNAVPQHLLDQGGEWQCVSTLSSHKTFESFLTLHADKQVFFYVPAAGYLKQYKQLPMFVGDIMMENGKTIKENNLDIKHDIPIGTLVEIVSEDSEYDDDKYGGMRLYVVRHSRDCDGEALYDLGYRGLEKDLEKYGTTPKREDFDDEMEFMLTHLNHTQTVAKPITHFSKDSLKVIRYPEVPKEKDYGIPELGSYITIFKDDGSIWTNIALVVEVGPVEFVVQIPLAGHVERYKSRRTQWLKVSDNNLKNYNIQGKRFAVCVEHNTGLITAKETTHQIIDYSVDSNRVSFFNVLGFADTNEEVSAIVKQYMESHH